MGKKAIYKTFLCLFIDIVPCTEHKYITHLSEDLKMEYETAVNKHLTMT